MNGQQNGTGIGGWFRGRWQQYQVHKTQEEMLHQATERIVEVADPVIRQARKYRHVLKEPVAGAIAYCSTLVGGIPGPFELSRRGYHASPVVKSLFASPDELEEVVRISPEVSAYLESGYSGNVSALLTMARQEKTIFGYQQDGEVIMRDVAQTAVNFFDHRVVSIGGNLDETKDRIARRGLEVLATVAMENITTLRAKKAELQEKKAYLRAVLKILGGKSHVLEMFAAPDPAKIEEYRKAEKKLVEIEQELAVVREKIATPEQSLGYLEDIMKSPGNTIAMESRTDRLNWMGVRVVDKPGSESNDITLAEFSVGEELRRSAVLVTFSLGNEQVH